MRCRQAKRLLFCYIDGVISESDRVRLERHLAECRTCEKTASALSRSLDLLHRLPSESPSENFNWKLRLRLARARNAWRDSTGLESAWQRTWNTRFAVGAVSAFLVVLVGGIVLLEHDWRGPGGEDRFAHLAPSSVRESPEAGTRAREDRSWAHTPFALPRSNGIVSQPVATGAVRGWGNGMSGRTSGPLVDVDSLTARYLGARMEARRIRQLEQQIDILHDELEKCYGKRDE